MAYWVLTCELKRRSYFEFFKIQRKPLKNGIKHSTTKSNQRAPEGLFTQEKIADMSNILKVTPKKPNN